MGQTQMKMVPKLMIILSIPLCSVRTQGDVINLKETLNTTNDYFTVVQGKHFYALGLTLNVTYKADFYSSACSEEGPCFPYFIIGRGKQSCDRETRGVNCTELLETIGNLHVYKQSLSPGAGCNALT